uniref:(northern house mosquito) hypothetical protein n=1 Tax=Culex pipiens TaxID=7175 RepID=A0A8D8B148_CULPI
MLKNCLIFSSIFSSSSKLLAQSLEGSSSSGVASSTTTFGAGPSPPPFSKNFRNETPLRGMAVWVAVSSVGTDSVICATECVRIKLPISRITRFPSVEIPSSTIGIRSRCSSVDASFISLVCTGSVWTDAFTRRNLLHREENAN